MSEKIYRLKWGKTTEGLGIRPLLLRKSYSTISYNLGCRQRPIQTPVLDRLGQVWRLDIFFALKIGYGPGDFQDAVVGPG